MFGVTRHNRPRIQLLSELIQDLTTGAAERTIVYGVVYLSFGAPHMSLLRYVRDHDDFGEALREFALLQEQCGDRQVVTDSLLCYSAPEDDAEEVEDIRGLFEYAMGLHHTHPAEDLVPAERVAKALIKYVRRGQTPNFGTSDSTGAPQAFLTNDPGDHDAEIVEAFLRSLDGKDPGDVDKHLN